MKPCPFCNSIDIATHVEYVQDRTYRAWAYCRSCGARGPGLSLTGNSEYQAMHAVALGAWESRVESKP